MRRWTDRFALSRARRPLTERRHRRESGRKARRMWDILVTAALVIWMATAGVPVKVSN